MVLPADTETRVPWAQVDDPQRASVLPQRESNWRDVLKDLPASGTRVDMSTGRRLAECDIHGKIIKP
jgi:hypothetical protein